MKSPRLGPAALNNPQQEVQVWFCGSGDPVKVTRNNVVVALRPFTIGIMFSPALMNMTEEKYLRLELREERGQKRLLGTIHLELTERLELPPYQLCLFRANGCKYHQISVLDKCLHYLREKRRIIAARRGNPYNFRMAEPDLRCNEVFYICPRPVVLVTVEHGGAVDMFPMDLIGPTDSPWFTLALRNSSPSLNLMQSSRRLALADVPWSSKSLAYELGKHHKSGRVDWEALRVKTVASPLFGLPVIDAALRVREVRIEEFHQIDSHTLFITTIENETVLRNGLQLFHRFGKI